MFMRTVRRIAILCCACIPVYAHIAAAQPEPGLLFRLSGDTGFIADHAAGSAEPMFLANCEIIPDGAVSYTHLTLPTN